jgi:flavin reductase
MHPPSTSSPTKAEFREAMSRLSSAVCIITSDGVAGRLGFTASAVCSVSDEPPTLLFCMNRRSEQNLPLKENAVFCVNMLGGGQEDLSSLFAGVGGVDTAKRFEMVSWHTLATGSPVISECVAACDCRVESIHELGTHSVIVGSILALAIPTPCLPSLSYFARRYHHLPSG